MTKAIAHVGDTGTILVKVLTDGTNIIDISGQTTLNLHIQRPDGTVVILAGSFVDTGVDGEAKFTTIVTTWNEAGQTLEQVNLVLPSGDWAGVVEKRIVQARIF